MATQIRANTQTRAGTITDTEINAAAAIGWSKISKSGSSLADLATRSAGDLTGTLANAVQDTITRTGALDSGSITSGFGAINVGSDSITGGAVSGTTGVFATSVSTPSLITASGALTITPAAGSNLNLALSTTGDFAVNTNQLYVDTSAGNVGIGTTGPNKRLTLVDATNGNTTIAFTSNAATTQGGAFWQTQGQVINWFMGGNYLNNTAVTNGLEFSEPAGVRMFIKTGGNVGIGTTSPGTKLDVNGSIGSRHATGGIGYTTGAGGTVTQATSKATAFTLSKVSGQITTANDALAAGTSVSATWTNTAIAATDVVLITHVSGGTVGAYAFNVACGAGSATLTITNRSAGSLSEALVLGFVVLKGVTS